MTKQVYVRQGRSIRMYDIKIDLKKKVTSESLKIGFDRVELGDVKQRGEHVCI